MRRLALVAAAAALWLATTGAIWLQFQSLPASGQATTTVTGLLRVPVGKGPFPAAVLLADCNGITPHERTWDRRFAGMGYVAYLIDSFFTRGITTTCHGTASFPVQDDLRGAIAKLQTLKTVDAKRIVVVGWQSGADAALAFDADGGKGAAVVVAFYPSCAKTPPLKLPTIFVLPGDAPSTPACEAYVGHEQAAKKVPVRVLSLPGVGAGFDCQECKNSYLGGPGGYDAPTDRKTLIALRRELKMLLQAKQP